MSCAKRTEPIEMQFGMPSQVDSENMCYMGKGKERKGRVFI